jgi:IS1 family transposase
MPPPRIPIGIDDFRTLREAGLEYVDKSDLIRQLLDRSGVEVVLLPRPRRFGKTLNLSLLRCWFEKRAEDLSHLFEALSIWQAGNHYRAHFQRYPVIHLSFKESKLERFERTQGAIRTKIQRLFHEHHYLLGSERLTEWELQAFRAILDGTAEQALFDRALLDLSGYLHAHHGEKVVILIDEYDEPIHAGHVHGYANEILDFMQAFLGAGLKSNVHLYRAQPRCTASRWRSTAKRCACGPPASPPPGSGRGRLSVAIAGEDTRVSASPRSRSRAARRARRQSVAPRSQLGTAPHSTPCQFGTAPHSTPW